MKRLTFACLALAASTCTCLAAEFYVVQDTANKQCRVVEQKPSDAQVLIVGSGNQAYGTKAHADTTVSALLSPARRSEAA